MMNFNEKHQKCLYIGKHIEFKLREDESILENNKISIAMVHAKTITVYYYITTYKIMVIRKTKRRFTMMNDHKHQSSIKFKLSCRCDAQAQVF